MTNLVPRSQSYQSCVFLCLIENICRLYSYWYICPRGECFCR
jgi:hypothetical protein